MGNEMVKVEDYSLASQGQAVAETLAVNTRGRPIGPRDLDEVRVPAAGNTMWQIPDLGNIVNQEALTGIIIHWREERAYWQTSFDESGGGSDPDCQSKDGVMGQGNPGGDCSACPMAEFGSGDKGSGQACQLRRILYLVRTDDLLPIMVSIPPGSIKAIHKYFLSLASKGVKFFHVETELRLTPTQNKAGIKFSQVTPRVSKRLTKDMVEKVDSYVDQIKASLESMPSTAGREAPPAQAAPDTEAEAKETF